MTEAALNLTDDAKAEPWTGPGEKPHDYFPDIMAMGDCMVCGHTYESHLPPGAMDAKAEPSKEPHGDLTSALEVMDLLRSRSDPLVRALNRAQMDDSCRIGLAYAIIADRKDRAAQALKGEQS